MHYIIPLLAIFGAIVLTISAIRSKGGDDGNDIARIFGALLCVALVAGWILGDLI